VHGQIAFVKAAKTEGADWIILQPPQIRKSGQRELIDFLGAVADRSELPVAIQNNPVNLDVWLTSSSLSTLNRNHPNISILKHDAPPCDIRTYIEDTNGVFDVFCGLGGRELPSCLQAGCVGVIPAPDCVDTQVQIFNLMTSGRLDENEAALGLHRHILPELVFAQSSPEHMLCYGKYIMAKRLGLETPSPRQPCLSPVSFGIEEAIKHAQAYGPLVRSKVFA
jgi:4-hydroxy-tetrahydrodipicolinate synthase